MQLSITKALPTDINTIQSLIQRIWKPTYQHILSEAQMEYMLKMMYSTEVLEKQFETGHQFLLMHLNDESVGFAGFQLDYEKEGVTKLHKIYLLPETQGKNAGKTLFNEVTGIAKNAGQQRLILNVNRYNKAFAFYQKLGMQIAEEVDVEIGNGYFMNDYIMSIDL